MAYSGKEIRQRILSVLSNEDLSGQQVREQTNLTIEDFATHMPKLRAAGLVESWKQSKATINHLIPGLHQNNAEALVQNLVRVVSPASVVTLRLTPR